MRNIEYQQLPNGELSYKLFSESGQLQQSGTTTQEAADSGLFGADTSDNYNVSYAEPIERVGTGLSTEVSAGSVRPGSTSFAETYGGQPAQAAAAQAVEPQDDVVRRSDEGPSGGYPQFVQDLVPRAADIGQLNPQTFESPIATEYDSFDMDSFAGDALDQFGQTTGIDSVESIRLQREAFDKYQAEQAALGGDPNEPRSDDNPGGYTGMQRVEPQYQDMISELAQPQYQDMISDLGGFGPIDQGDDMPGPGQAGAFSGSLGDYFKSLQPESGDGSRIAPEISTTNLGVSSLGDASSNDLQRMLNRGTLATGTVSDVQDRIDPTGERAQIEPTAPVPQFFDGMGDGPQFLNMGDGYGAGIDAAIPGDQTNGENLPSSGAPNPIIDVLGTGNVLDPGTSGLARAGSASDFGVQDTFNPDMMSNLQSSSMQLPSFGQAMQPQASLPQGGLGSLSQPIPSLQQFNISGSYNAPPIKSPFV